MKTKYIILITFFFWTISFAQKRVSFEQITSENVLQVFGKSPQEKATAQSNSTVLQVGNFNEAYIYDVNPQKIAINQIGNDNTTRYINTTNKPTNAEISTVGNGNYIDMVGSNSISEKLKMNINNSNMIIFIRNY